MDDQTHESPTFPHYHDSSIIKSPFERNVKISKSRPSSNSVVENSGNHRKTGKDDDIREAEDQEDEYLEDYEANNEQDDGHGYDDDSGYDDYEDTDEPAKDEDSPEYYYYYYYDYQDEGIDISHELEPLPTPQWQVSGGSTTPPPPPTPLR